MEFMCPALQFWHLPKSHRVTVPVYFYCQAETLLEPMTASFPFNLDAFWKEVKIWTVHWSLQEEVLSLQQHVCKQNLSSGLISRQCFIHQRPGLDEIWAVTFRNCCWRWDQPEKSQHRMVRTAYFITVGGIAYGSYAHILWFPWIQIV